MSYQELELEWKMSAAIGAVFGPASLHSPLPGKVLLSLHSVERAGEGSAFIISVCRL